MSRAVNDFLAGIRREVASEYRTLTDNVGARSKFLARLESNLGVKLHKVQAAPITTYRNRDKCSNDPLDRIGKFSRLPKDRNG